MNENPSLSLPVSIAVTIHDVAALCDVLLVALTLHLDGVLGVTVVRLVSVLETTSTWSSTGGGGEAEKKDCRQHGRGC